MACIRKEPATDLDEQFQDFASMMDARRDGTTINLCRSDYWLSQANIIDNRKVTLEDTTVSFNKFIVDEPPPPEPKKNKLKKKIIKEESVIFRKDEINYVQWLNFLKDLCITKKICLMKCKEQLTQCGLPGHKAPLIWPYYYYIPRRKWPNDIVLYEDTFADSIKEDISASLAV